jgi:riboflavin kinase/FMN adenylyltransferase
MEIVNLNYPIDPTVQLKNEPCVMALGFFDGVHRGHRKIIETAKAIAKKEKIKFTVMTFFPHPSNVIPTQKKINRYITPLPIKQELFASMGVEKLFIVNFNMNFSKLDHQQFVEQYIVGLHCKHVVAGFDFTYGFKGQGDMEQMVTDSKNRFEVTTVSKLEHNHEKISSTLIREVLNTGEVENIPLYLEDHYSIKGKVVRDRYLNDKETILTIEVDQFYHLPKKGLYEIKVQCGESMIFGSFDVPIQNTGTIEVLLVHNCKIYYEKDVTVYLIKKKLEEQKNGQTEDENKNMMSIVI